MKCSISSARRRDGFTLLELLVVVGIIAVLAAMLFPAVQRLREMANRTRCVNNLHQIGMALSNHFSTHGYFPTNGATIPPSVSYPFSLTSYPGSSPTTVMWGMGDPNQGPKTQTASWAYAILPFMEETNAFKNVDYTVGAPLFMCPSRGRPTPQLVSSPDTFGWFYNAQTSNGTPLNPWGKTDYAGNYLVMPNSGISDLRYYFDFSTKQPLLPPYPSLGGARNYPIAPSDMTDGAANTIIVGEKAMAVAAYNTGGWFWDEPIFTGGSGGTARGVPPFFSPLTLPGGPNSNQSVPFYSQPQFPSSSPSSPLPFYYYPAKFSPPVPSTPGVFPDNDPNMSASSPFPYIFANNWGSAHPGGVNFLFADGSVRTFNYNVDVSLFQGLLTPAGGDATPAEN